MVHGPSPLRRILWRTGDDVDGGDDEFRVSTQAAEKS
jgi:hypothetical protein